MPLISSPDDVRIIPSSPEDSISSPASVISTAPSSAVFLSPPESPEPNDPRINSKMITTATTRIIKENNDNDDDDVDDLDNDLDDDLDNDDMTITSTNTFTYHYKNFISSYNIYSLNEIINKASDHLKDILSRDYHTPTMIPTCMSTLPTGDERGTYLSVDLGGSTFRVAFVKLNGKEHENEVIYMSSVLVPDEIKQSTGKEFFLWMAKQVQKGVNEVIKEPSSSPLKMGISWSFPFIQTSMNTAFIEKMGKGYSVADEISSWNLGEAFEEAFQELNLNIKVQAIVNDGSAVMISRAYVDNSTKLSLILGTGINAGVMIPSQLIGSAKLQSLINKHESNYMINTEISMINDIVIPDTIWDIELDAAVERPGFQPLETKVSGRYIGEISRLIIRDMVLNNNLCGGILPDKFNIPYSLESSLMSDCEELYRNNRLDLSKELFTKQHAHPTLGDSDMKRICEIFVAVSNRSAAFTASVLVALSDILHKASPSTSTTISQYTIAYTGTVIEKYPFFRSRCQQYLDTLTSTRGIQLRLESTQNGSIFGPVIAAAMQ